MPDWLAYLLVAGAPVVEQRSADDVELAGGAEDLGTIANAGGAAGVLVRLNVGHIART